METLELGVGVRGPAARGKQLTEASTSSPTRPRSTGREQEGDQVDIQLAAVRSHRIRGFPLHYGAVAGSEQAFVHGGVEWRHGEGAALLRSRRCCATRRLRPASSAPPGWAIFAGASLRGVAHNAMIERNYDPYGPELEPRHAVGRAAIGAAWVCGWGSVTFALAWNRASSTRSASRRPSARSPPT
jgi:hypothetical protein